MDSATSGGIIGATEAAGILQMRSACDGHGHNIKGKYELPRKTGDLLALSSPISAMLFSSAAQERIKATWPIAIARTLIRDSTPGRFFNVVDLVNRLETETRNGEQGPDGEFTLETGHLAFRGDPSLSED